MLSLPVLDPARPPAGVEVWRGPSRLDPSVGIVAVATGVGRPSQNPKTGPMVQLWVLLADVHPVEAVRTRADAAICGGCPLGPGRPDGAPRLCYVAVGRAPSAVWSAWRDGAYPRVSAARVAELSRGRAVRLGAYGDPAAVPTRVLRALVSRASGWTGYSHEWRRRPSLRGLLMASCDSAADLADARARGWRGFVVVPPDGAAPDGAIPCPATPEGGHRSSCDRCRLCSGAAAAGTGRRGSSPVPDVWVRAHGGAAVARAWRRGGGPGG